MNDALDRSDPTLGDARLLISPLPRSRRSRPMKDAVHPSLDSPNTSRRFARGASNVYLVGGNSTCPVPGHSRDARVYGHTTTAIHKLSTPPPPPPPPRPNVFFPSANRRMATIGVHPFVFLRYSLEGLYTAIRCESTREKRTGVFSRQKRESA